MLRDDITPFLAVGNTFWGISRIFVVVYNDFKGFSRLNIGEIFTYNLRKALEESGASQRELADFLGVHVNTVQKWLRGQNDPSFATIEAIAGYFKVSPQSLMGAPEASKINQIRHELHTLIDHMDNEKALSELKHMAQALTQKALSKKEIG